MAVGRAHLLPFLTKERDVCDSNAAGTRPTAAGFGGGRGAQIGVVDATRHERIQPGIGGTCNYALWPTGRSQNGSEAAVS